jgi:hypothetical protein
LTLKFFGWECGECGCDCPDSPELAAWNGPSNSQNVNNCYNYAMNVKTDDFAQPGWAALQPFQFMTCSDVAVAAERDGVYRQFEGVPIASPPTCPETMCLVALYVDDGCDYHWFRKNEGLGTIIFPSSGVWSHKMGGYAATTRADDGGGEAEIGTSVAPLYRGPICDEYRFCEYMCSTCDLEICGDNCAADLPLPPKFKILAFSGRPNPGWDPNAAEVQSVLDRLGGLVPQPEPLDPFPDWSFGHIGFSLDLYESEGLHVSVYNGMIQVFQYQMFTYYYADDNGLEDYLIERAVARNFSDLVREPEA